MESTLTQRKRVLRNEVLSRRDALSEPARKLASQLITDRLLSLKEIEGARVVLAYVSMGSEVETSGFLQSVLDQGKRLVLPRVNRETRCLNLYAVGDLLGDLEPGTWGIREPQPERCEVLSDTRSIDVVLVPGVAFTPACKRMGYGGGFYDKLLGGWQGEARLIAAAFDLQMVQDLPTGPTDMGVDHIVTPTRTFACALQS